LRFIFIILPAPF